MPEPRFKQEPPFQRFSLEELARVLWSHLRAPLVRAVHKVMEERRHPTLVSAAYIAHEADVSPSTVYRHVKRYGIPWRNIHGAPWKEGDGPRRIAWAEWQSREALHTRTVKNDLHRSEQSVTE